VASSADRLTGSFVVEVVVVLRHVCENAEFVGHGHRQHVLGVEQRRNAEMLAGHIERLQRNGTLWCKKTVAQESKQRTTEQSISRIKFCERSQIFRRI